MKKIKYNSPVILSFTLLSLFILILGYISNNYITNMFFCTYKSSLFNPLTYFRLFSYVFGHQNFQHWFNNILLILILGPMLEEKYGSEKLLIMMTITAFTTGVFNNLIFNTGLLGASGIVFMFIILASFTNYKSDGIPLTFILVIIFYIGQEVISSLSIDNVSQFAHIFGGIIGGIFGFIKQKK